MKEPLYRVVLHQAWQITIKHKFLWFFGLFTSIATAKIFEPVLRNLYYVQDPNLILKKLLWFAPQNYTGYLSWTDFGGVEPGTWSSLLFILSFAMIGIFGIWFVIISQNSLISAAATYYTKGRAKIEFLKLIDAGNKKLWIILMLNLIVRLLLWAIFILLTLPIFIFIVKANLLAQILALILFFLIFTAIEMITSFMLIYAANFIILDKLDLFEAIREAYNLIKNNPLISLETAFILLGLELLVLACLVTAIVFVALPFLVIFYLSLIAEFAALAVFSVAIGLMIIIFLAMLTWAIFTTFYVSSWTVLFIKLTREKPMGKIHRLEYRIKHFLKNRKKKKK